MSKRCKFLDYKLFLGEEIPVTNKGIDVFLVEMVDESDESELEENEENIRRDIRDFLLDLIDIANYKGIYLPIVLLIKTKNKEFWEKIAGDQDWHRGEFYIIPVKTEQKVREMKDILLEELKDFGSMKVRRITKDEVIKFLTLKKRSLDKFTKLERKYYEILVEEAIKTLKSETRNKLQFFEDWKEKIENDLKRIISEGEKYDKSKNI